MCVQEYNTGQIEFSSKLKAQRAANNTNNDENKDAHTRYKLTEPRHTEKKMKEKKWRTEQPASRLVGV